MKNNEKKFRYYEIYETKSHGKVKLLKYSEEAKNKRRVCKMDGSNEIIYISENELIPHERKRKRRETKRSPVEAQREFHTEMIKLGYKPKTYYLSKSNILKLDQLKEASGIETWNEFMNELIEKL